MADLAVRNATKSAIEPRIASSPMWSGERGAIMIALLVGAVMLLPRLRWPFATGIYLWAEDGNIFINQAGSGIHALWTPYAGYLHVYPRLVAFLVSDFDLNTQANCFVAAWMVALAITLAVIARQARRLGIPKRWIAVIVAATVLLPSDGEMFFNVTNAQWLLGLALAIFLLTVRAERFHTIEWIGVIVVALTGPFSLLLLPLIVVRLVFERLPTATRIMLGVAMTAGCIQLLMLLFAGRGRLTAQISDSALHLALLFVVRIVQMVLLGGKSIPARLAAVVFVAGFVVALISLVRARSPEARARLRTVLLLLASACVQIVTAMLVLLREQGTFVFLATSRYAVIPYGLIFFAAAMAARDRRLTNRVLMAGLLISLSFSFQPVTREDMAFRSFINLARYMPTDIPINPRQHNLHEWWWGMHRTPMKPPVLPVGISMQSNNLIVSGNLPDYGLVAFGAASPTDQVALRDPVHCSNASDIGLFIRMERAEAGMVELRWAEGTSPINHALSEGYRAGAIDARFAVPNVAGGVSIRIFPQDSGGSVRIDAIMVHCLPAEPAS